MTVTDKSLWLLWLVLFPLSFCVWRLVSQFEWFWVQKPVYFTGSQKCCSFPQLRDWDVRNHKAVRKSGANLMFTKSHSTRARAHSCELKQLKAIIRVAGSETLQFVANGWSWGRCYQQVQKGIRLSHFYGGHFQTLLTLQNITWFCAKPPIFTVRKMNTTVISPQIRLSLLVGSGKQPCWHGFSVLREKAVWPTCVSKAWMDVGNSCQCPAPP